ARPRTHPRGRSDIRAASRAACSTPRLRCGFHRTRVRPDCSSFTSPLLNSEPRATRLAQRFAIEYGRAAFGAEQSSAVELDIGPTTLDLRPVTPDVLDD